MSENIYQDLAFPEPSETRPYTYIDMIATIDGKTVSGHRGEDVLDLGSKLDHQLMRRIEDQSDAVMIGATTHRASDKRWNPGTKFRIVVSNRGGLDYSLPYFQGGGKAYIACSENSQPEVSQGVERLVAGKDKVDAKELVNKLRQMGVKHLFCLGGSELNAQLLAADLVDELFLTIAPRIKLGRELPTYAGGEPLPREQMLQFEIKESHVVGDEVFLRYRRKPEN